MHQTPSTPTPLSHSPAAAASASAAAPGGTRGPVVVSGEALIDLIEQADGRLLPHLGGSPWNLARALGRLLGRQGSPVRYLNPLSGDDFGSQLAEALAESQVLCMGGRSPWPTSLALVKIDTRGQPAYTFYREGVADRDLSPDQALAPWVQGAEPCALFHVGSLAVMPPDGHAWLRALAALVARGVPTSIDINMRPRVARDAAALADYAALSRQILAQGRVVKVSDEDLQALGLNGDPLVQARGLLNEVTQVVVLTLGAAGAWGLTRSGESFQAPAQVPVLDTVGAGDCFYAGVLAHLLEQGGLDTREAPAPALVAEALAFGNRVTAHNLQRAGCQPPWRHQL